MVDGNFKPIAYIIDANSKSQSYQIIHHSLDPKITIGLEERIIPWTIFVL